MSSDYETNKLSAYDHGATISVWFKYPNGFCIDLDQELLDNLNEIWQQKLKLDKGVGEM